MGPPPIIPSRGDKLVKENTVALVRYSASSMPSLGGTAGREPVQIAALLKRRVLPATTSRSEPVDCAPRKDIDAQFIAEAPGQVLPADLRPDPLHPRHHPAKSTKSPLPPSMPNSAASRPLRKIRAALISPLEGTQPAFRLSPPMRWRSTRATSAPRPTVPAPIPPG
jgi:hypothetical protein